MSDKKAPKRPIGRPTKYSDDIIEMAKDYLDFELFETVSKEVIVRDQIQVTSYERPSKIPSIAGLARHLKIHRETIYNWAKEHPAFFDILGELQVMQEEFLEYHGLTKGYDSSFAKFITQNVTRYRDKMETKTESKAEITVNIDNQDTKL